MTFFNCCGKEHPIVVDDNGSCPCIVYNQSFYIDIREPHWIGGFFTLQGCSKIKFLWWYLKSSLTLPSKKRFYQTISLWQYLIFLRITANYAGNVLKVGQYFTTAHYYFQLFWLDWQASNTNFLSNIFQYTSIHVLTYCPVFTFSFLHSVKF